ncbi:UvrD-helicase domain-containing protein [Leptospira wolffii]|uniref:RecBCD enzyme subunit RecB n=1 Tax=Leptospira wolffii TaxID=409998 RepID=A0ABV5BS65_9LEPT
MPGNDLSAKSGDFVDGIDISKNGFIAASAGTGKTHTIVFLVLKILKESFLSSLKGEKNPIGIESILILTYTDKAASELRGRVRAELKNRISELERKMADALPEEIQELDFFRNQSAKLDQAYISTIHGFAHKILKEYSLEIGQPENTELVKETAPIAKALYGRMRQEFRGEYPKWLLPFLIYEAQESYKDGFHRKTWENLVCDLAVKKAGAPDTVELLPRPEPFPSWESVSKAILVLSESFPRLLQRQENIRKGINPQTYKAIQIRQKDFQESLSILKANEASFDSISFTLALKRILNLERSKRTGWDVILLNEEELKKATEEEGYPSYISERDSFRQIGSVFSELKNSVSSFVISLAEDLVEDSVLIKSEQGQITYGDMILHLANALRGKSETVTLLRKRFRYGIIDEFQDTDSEQFQIFSTLFLEESKSPERPGSLFLIGDAKQSIYGFRGADLNTYLAAKSDLDTGGRFASSSLVYPELDTNRRSLPELIEAYNTLFASSDGGWFPIQEGNYPPIEYSSVRAPEKPGKAVLYSDKSGRAALNAFACSPGKNSDSLKEEYSQFLAEEILHLVSKKSLVLNRENGNSSGYATWSDIAILVRSWQDADLLRRQLRARGIPYTYHKQAGLFKSGEAIRIRELLICLHEEGSRDSFYKLLVSDLFHISPLNLKDYEEYPIESREKRLLESWRRFARKKDYPGLFRSLLTESGLSSPSENESLPDWERKIANFRQIFYSLSEYSSGKNLGLSELVSYLESEIASDKDDDYLERDSEEDRVRILTMHLSKGLEFPIVFLFGGFTGWGNTSRSKIFEYSVSVKGENGEEGKRKIVSLDPSPGVDILRNTMNEDKRLYYVAVTRAMYKFYFPLLPASDPKRPLELFRQSFQASIHKFPEESSVQMIRSLEDGDGYATEWIRKGKKKEESAPGKKSEKTKKNHISVPEWPRDAEARKIVLESYSSLDKFLQNENLNFQPEESRTLKMDETPSQEETITDLPSSSRMGNLLHQLLETADFEEYRKAKSPKELSPTTKKKFSDLLRMYGYSVDRELSEKFSDRIAELLWNTLRSPFLEDGICLANIGTDDRKHEVDFYLESDSAGEDLLNGTVDLIFRHQDRYWILDWKSNLLESDSGGKGGYSQESISKKVQTSYSLQLYLYSVVLDRWLQFKYGKDYDPNLMGGMYFLFLRGMDPNKIERGVFLQKLSPEFLQTSKEKVREALAFKKGFEDRTE